MSAPEPVEVQADELAAAEAQSNRTSELFMRMIAQKVSNPTTRRHIEAYMAEYDRLRAVLERIADAHTKYVDERGGNYGTCDECERCWPCPTHVWATTKRNAAVSCWNPDDDEDADDD